MVSFGLLQRPCAFHVDPRSWCLHEAKAAELRRVLRTGVPSFDIDIFTLTGLFAGGAEQAHRLAAAF